MAELHFPSPAPEGRNSLTGSATGGIAYSRTVDPATMLHTDNFLHYNQVGTVIARSNATGNSAVKVYQDVFGNAPPPPPPAAEGGPVDHKGDPKPSNDTPKGTASPCKF